MSALEVAVIAACVALLIVGWFAARRRLRLKGRPDAVYTAQTADGWSLTLRRYFPKGESRFAEPVILCHGLGANHSNVDFDPPYGLAQYLAARGRDCFVLSLRAHGDSARPGRRNHLRWGFSFDDYRDFDVPAVIARVRELTGARQVQWAAHSMGGMLALALGGTPLERSLAGIAAIGTPASFVEQQNLRWLAQLAVLLTFRGRFWFCWLARLAAPMAGVIEPPFSRFVTARGSIAGPVLRRLYANVFEDVSGGVVFQFADWVLNGTFRSLDGTVDYRESIRALQVPVLLVGGNQDLLAPPAGMRLSLDRLGSADKTLVVMGRERGDACDYGHGDLIFGSSAPQEVFPVVGAWLERRATRLVRTQVPVPPQRQPQPHLEAGRNEIIPGTGL